MQSCKLFGTSRLAGGFLFIQKGGEMALPPFLWECVAAFFRRKRAYCLFRSLSHWMMPKNTHTPQTIFRKKDR